MISFDFLNRSHYRQWTQTKGRAIIIERELNQNKNIVSERIYDKDTEYHIGGTVDNTHLHAFF